MWDKIFTSNQATGGRPPRGASGALIPGQREMDIEVGPTRAWKKMACAKKAKRLKLSLSLAVVWKRKRTEGLNKRAAVFVSAIDILNDTGTSARARKGRRGRYREGQKRDQRENHFPSSNPKQLARCTWAPSLARSLLPSFSLSFAPSYTAPSSFNRFFKSRVPSALYLDGILSFSPCLSQLRSLPSLSLSPLFHSLFVSHFFSVLYPSRYCACMALLRSELMDEIARPGKVEWVRWVDDEPNFRLIKELPGCVGFVIFRAR